MDEPKDAPNSTHILPILKPAMQAYLAGFPGRDRITVRMFGAQGSQGSYPEIVVGWTPAVPHEGTTAFSMTEDDPLKNALRCVGASERALSYMDPATASRVIKRRMKDYGDHIALEMSYSIAATGQGWSWAALRDLNRSPATTMTREGRHTMQGDLIELAAYLALSL